VAVDEKIRNKDKKGVVYEKENCGGLVTAVSWLYGGSGSDFRTSDRMVERGAD
jgi:hypothetical protein